MCVKLVPRVGSWRGCEETERSKTAGRSFGWDLCRKKRSAFSNEAGHRAHSSTHRRESWHTDAVSHALVSYSTPKDDFCHSTHAPTPFMRRSIVEPLHGAVSSASHAHPRRVSRRRRARALLAWGTRRLGRRRPRAARARSAHFLWRFVSLLLFLRGRGILVRACFAVQREETYVPQGL